MPVDNPLPRTFVVAGLEQKCYHEKRNMCGIIGYIGNKQALPILIDGLKRLEYRGYDSSGVSVLGKRTFCVKLAGRIADLENRIQGKSIRGNLGIGHSRWSTHGAPTNKNAHPHWDCKKEIFVVHNGIIENYKVLKEKLEKEGHKFNSETDTETIVHLVEKFFRGNLEEAVRKALKLVKGTYGIAVISKNEPNKIVVARNSSPLLVGIGKDEYIVASDASAVVGHTKNVVYLNDEEIGVITPEDFHILTLAKQPVKKDIQELDWDVEEAEKGGFPHFMLKEILEQPEAIENAIRGRLIKKEGLAKLGGLEDVEKKLRKIKKIIIIACGTSYYAGLIGEYMLEEYAGIPTEVEYASEFRYRKPILDPPAGGTAVIAISQSGETADTLAAIREVKRKGVLTLGIVNVVGSTIARETDAGVYNHAGPEIGVASTKVFVSQLSILALFTLFLGRQRQMSLVMGKRISEELSQIPVLAKKVLAKDNEIKKLAKKYHKFSNLLYIGRKYNYPIALEGALKIKEISYVHAEGYSSGEMKHGPIALIDENFPTIAIAPSDSVYEKMISNIEEIKARNGPIIALATQRNKKIEKLVDDVIYIPKTLEMLTPILSVIPLQLLAYHVGVLKGCDVDKPRNLAKSVTVE